MIKDLVSRRGLLSAGALGLGGALLSGCDPLSRSPSVQSLTGRAEGLTLASQRLLLANQPLAREFKASDLSPIFRANGSILPDSAQYRALAADGFNNYQLVVDGLVRRPIQLTLAQIKAMPARTQITRHDCVEGWSAIGGWTGVQLARILSLVQPLAPARYVVFHCADNLGGSSDNTGLYYESIDLFDAYHPQTILAWAMNGQPLPVAHGAPLRLRVERQLGYKQAKYVMRIELAERMDQLGRGKGGFWEDRGYAWYAGI